jgi:hypothetical protein
MGLIELLDPITTAPYLLAAHLLQIPVDYIGPLTARPNFRTAYIDAIHFQVSVS